MTTSKNRPFVLMHETPLGALRLLADEHHLTHVYWPVHKGAIAPETQDGTEHPVLREAAAQLDAYFAGELKDDAFDLPIKPAGTAFQREVWTALQTLPWGETWSYSDLASALGRPNAVRAVGAANGRNPLSIIVPCHRVIGRDGSLTGYAGGVDTKRWLLHHEGVQLSAGAVTSDLKGHHGEQLSLIGP